MASSGKRGVVRKLRIGVQLPGSERRVPWSEYLAMARTAEEVGFDSIRVGDHLLYRDEGRPDRGPLELWTLLGALAAATSRIRLGSHVACVAFHSPALIAKMAATVDAISDGRFVLGVGAGWNEVEFRAFGMPFTERVGRFEESFDIVRRLLAGERVTSTGRFWSVDEAVLVPPPAHRVPLMIGANGDRMLSIGLPHTDWWSSWFTDYGNSVAGYTKTHARVSTAAERAGRRPEQVARSVAVLVQVDAELAARVGPNEDQPRILAELPEFLHALAEAGADEAVLVMQTTMTESAIRALGEVLGALDGAAR